MEIVIAEKTEISAAIDGFLDWAMVERGLSENTLAAYSLDLMQFGGYLGDRGIRCPEDVAPGIIAGHLRSLADMGLSAGTIARRMSSIRGLFRYLILEGYIKRDPTEGLKPPKLSRHLPGTISPEQVDSILAAIDLTHPRGLGIRDRAMLETLYGTGARESELLGMKTSDIYPDIGFVRLFGKGRKERLVPINRSALHWIDRYKRDVRPALLRKGKRTPILFLNARGGKLSRMGIYKIVTRWSRAAGIEGVHPHTFRHAFATHLIEGGADLRAVQEMLGHADISTTQIYTNVGKSYLHEVYREFHPRGN